MNDALSGDTEGCVIADGSAGIEVAIKARESTAADLEADGMTGEVRRHPAIDDKFLDPSGRQGLGSVRDPCGSGRG